MKTKTDATKVLLESGWTYEEIEAVLGDKICLPLQNSFHASYPPQPQFVEGGTGKPLGSPPVIICGKEVRECDNIKRTKLTLRDVL